MLNRKRLSSRVLETYSRIPKSHPMRLASSGDNVKATANHTPTPAPTRTDDHKAAQKIKSSSSTSSASSSTSPSVAKPESQKAAKSMAQIDEEIRLKMEGLAGDGGESGAELEDGKPVAMKRSVRENMFRYI